jgi:hypothetical protein
MFLFKKQYFSFSTQINYVYITIRRKNKLNAYNYDFSTCICPLYELKKQWSEAYGFTRKVLLVLHELMKYKT